MPHVKVSLFRAFLPFRLISVPHQGQCIQGLSSIQADKCAAHQGQSVQGFSPIQAGKCAASRSVYSGLFSHSG